VETHHVAQIWMVGFRLFLLSNLLSLFWFYFNHNRTNKQAKVQVKTFNFSRKKNVILHKLNWVGKITCNHAMISNGFVSSLA